MRTKDQTLQYVCRAYYIKNNMRLKDIGRDDRCKLTDRQISTIRKSRTVQKELAEKYGISRQRVSQIQDRRGTQEAIKKAEAKAQLQRYRTDKEFNAKMKAVKKKIYQKRKTYFGKKYKIYG